MSAAQIWSLYFGWPAGAVYSNLLASAICSLLVWWRLRARQARNHLEALTQSARQHKLLVEQSAAQHKDQMDLLRKQHSQLSDQVAEAPQTVTVHVAGPADPGAIAEAVKKAKKPPAGGM